MAHFEHLISRYLDGSLSAAELEQVERLMAESSEARAYLRELMAVAGAARRMPQMHRPAPRLEQRLFERLAAEGLYAPASAQQAGPAPSMLRRWQGVVAAMMALLVVLGGIGRIGNRGGAVVESGASRPALAAAVSNASSTHAARNNSALISAAPSNAAAPVAVSDHRRLVGYRHEQRNTTHVIGHDIVASAPIRAASSNEHNEYDDRAAAARSSVLSVPIEPRTVPVVEKPRNTDASVGVVKNSAVVLWPSFTPERGIRTAWSTSVRGGVATIMGSEGGSASEVDVKLGMQLADRHQISVVVGMGPAVSTTSISATGLKTPRGVSVASATRDQGNTPNGTTFDASNQPFVRKVASEPWVGLGYNYALGSDGDVILDPGVKGGASKSTIRIGAELPVRIRMSSTMSLECAASVARVFPIRSVGEQGLLTDATTRSLLLQTTQDAAFTSYGVQIGIRVNLGGDR